MLSNYKKVIVKKDNCVLYLHGVCPTYVLGGNDITVNNMYYKLGIVENYENEIDVEHDSSKFTETYRLRRSGIYGEGKYANSDIIVYSYSA